MQINEIKRWASDNQGLAAVLLGSVAIILLGGALSIPAAFAPPRSEAELAQIRERASREMKQKLLQAERKTPKQQETSSDFMRGRSQSELMSELEDLKQEINKPGGRCAIAQRTLQSEKDRNPDDTWAIGEAKKNVDQYCS